MIFKWLAQDFEHLLAKFRHFVEKQHAPMGQRNLAWLRGAATTNEASIGNCMVRRAKWASANKRQIAGQQAFDRINFGDIQGFVEA
ncbi:hypothetical protein SE18_24380 [Herpetosiphon geysericola]|uniref:Uncharacterized protein n=1 Tax=Herpetosiphon geysericola TaxID=70996 RepID=A0A0P6XUG1_9CHLR|nr:hypothetical protein SE18_24380 [Herpetosiphon geysericola]